MLVLFLFPRPRHGVVVVLVILVNEIARVGTLLGTLGTVGWLVWLVDAIWGFCGEVDTYLLQGTYIPLEKGARGEVGISVGRLI